jgi:hypothetical protein
MWRSLIHSTEMLLDIIQLSEAFIMYGALCTEMAAIFRWLAGWLVAAATTRFCVISYTNLGHLGTGFRPV